MTTAAGAHLQLALEQIQFARNYTLSLIEDVEDEYWFQLAPGGVSHLAWQVGHLAMAQYALALLRIRGKEPEDRDFITNAFFRKFMKGTVPNPDSQHYPPVAEIREVFHNVHRQVLREVPTYSEEVLQESLPEPYALSANKLGSLWFCSAHEMMHAGQIGLIRRQLGRVTLR